MNPYYTRVPYWCQQYILNKDFLYAWFMGRWRRILSFEPVVKDGFDYTGKSYKTGYIKFEGLTRPRLFQEGVRLFILTGNADMARQLEQKNGLGQENGLSWEDFFETHYFSNTDNNTLRFKKNFLAQINFKKTRV